MLSVSLITRDEESTIAAAIASIADVADEIVVVDTGSADRTKSLAAAAGARVVDFPWQDDFSAARNHAIQFLHGDWVMVIDADEQLLPESKHQLRRCLARESALGFTVIRRHLTDVANPQTFTESHVLRILRRVPGVHFVGRIHERLKPTIDQLTRQYNQRIYPTTIRLLHTGYASHLREAKLRRALPLLEMELAEHPGQLDYLIELGRTLLQLADPAGHAILGSALSQLWKRRHDPKPPAPLAAALLEYALTISPRLLQGPIFPSDAAALASRWFPNSPPLLWIAAQNHFTADRFAPAAASLERLLALSKSGAYDTSVPFDPRILGPDAAINLGGCYIRLAHLDRAERLFRSLLPHPAAQTNLNLITRLRATE